MINRFLSGLRKAKVTPTMMVAYVALFLAAGGSAYAVATINGADIIDESVPLSKLNQPVIKGKGKIDIGNRTVAANVVDPTLFTVPGFGTFTIYHAAPSDNENYCASDISAGGNGATTFKNTTSETESFWFSGLKVMLAPGAQQEGIQSDTDMYIAKNNKMVNINLQGSSVLDQSQEPATYTSCTYVWRYITSND